MKKVFIILLTLISVSSCVENEVMIKVDPGFVLSFQRDGKTEALAGNTFYVLPTGSGEFLTLFDGMPGIAGTIEKPGTPSHVWGESGAVGVDFNKADSLGVVYPKDSTYSLTLVATSTDNFGKKIIRLIKTVQIKVLDERNSITQFYINNIPGIITNEDSILFSFSDVTSLTNLTPIFNLSSPKATGYVNGVLQVSAETSNDFTQPVVYTIKSALGDEKNYIIKISTFPSSNENKIVKFNLSSVSGTGGNGEIGVIDENNKTITVNANYGTNLAKVKLIIESSYLSKVTINNINFSDRTFYNLISTVKTIKVTAQNGTESLYTLIVLAQNPIQSFTFIGLIPAPVGIIDITSKSISVDVLKGTDISKLVALWTGSIGTVQIGSKVQTNGSTVNDFTTPLSYTFYKGTTIGDQYTVIVNVK